MTPSPALTVVDAALRRHFGQAPARASVSFVGVDPIEVLRFEPIPDERAYLTLGMARHPMTPASSTFTEAHGPLAELMLHVRDATDAHTDVWRRLAVLAAAPSVEGVVYAPGMTVELAQPLVPVSRCTAVLVTDGPIGPVETEQGEVAILQVIPVTATELAWCRVRGAAALRALWIEHGTDLLDLTRAPVPLTG